MNPRLSTYDSADGCVSDSKHRANGKLCHSDSVKPSYLNNFFGSKFGILVTFTAPRNSSHYFTKPLSACCAPLVRHIFRILLTRSKKQMRRIAAWWVIAFVQNPKPLRDWPITQHPRQSVRQREDFFGHVKEPISMSAFACGPNPAPPNLLSNYRAVLVHLGPKSSLVIFRQLRDWSCSLHASIFRLRVSVCRLVIHPANALNFAFPDGRINH